MNLWTCMSLTGSISIIFYMIYKNIIKNDWSAAPRYHFLKVCLLLFLIPLPLLKRQMVLRIQNIQGFEQFMSFQFNREWHFGYWLKTPWNGKLFMNSKVFMVSLLIMSGFAILLFVHQVAMHIWSTHKLKDQIQENMKDIDMAGVEPLFVGKRKVEVAYCKGRQGSFTVGVLHPQIVLEQTVSETDYNMIIRHEMEHIRKLDIVIQLLSILVLIINWYNPLVYYFVWEMWHVCELACDEKVVENFSNEEKDRYIDLVLRASTCGKDTKDKETLGFSIGYRRVEERINFIMQKKKNTKFRKLITGCFIAVSVLCSSTAALAYEPLRVLELDELTQNTSGEIDYKIYLGEEADLEHGLPFTVKTDLTKLFEESDCIFIDMEGNVYPLMDGAVPFLTCKHTYQNGFIESHQKQDDGSCYVFTYKVQLCTKCGDFINPVYYNMTYNARCPHIIH